MATKIIMPKQGLQMTAGTITKWLVAEGGTVTEGEPLFEMETDKLTITIDANCSGTLLKIVRAEWETVPITELIAVVGEPGENIDAILAEARQAQAANAGAQQTPSAASPQTSRAAINNTVNQTPTAAASAPISAVARTGRVLISPRAKRLAQSRNIDYAAIPGSGENGMIVERDIAPFESNVDVAAAFAAAAQSATPTSSAPSDPSALLPPVVPEEGETVMKIAGMRRAVCENMTTSLRAMAQACHKISVDMSSAVKMRASFKERGESVSYNDILLYFTARTLADFPAMNAVSDAESILRKRRVNLGVAVALDAGLIVPTLFDADTMSFSQIHAQTAELAKKAKTGGLTKAEYSDGSFTVTNLGMFGLDEFTAIINPPQVGILAVGAIQNRVVAVDGQVVIRPMVTLTLTYDHRVIDGAPAAAFLKKLKIALEKGLEE